MVLTIHVIKLLSETNLSRLRHLLMQARPSCCDQLTMCLASYVPASVLLVFQHRLILADEDHSSASTMATTLRHEVEVENDSALLTLVARNLPMRQCKTACD